MATSQQTFSYLDAPQGSPEWVAARVGKVTASRLKDWMAVSKRDGKPLKARSDYEREIAFERHFNVPYSRFVTSAMEEGTVMEEFLKQQYSEQYNVIVKPCGAYYNDLFVASPDGLIGDDGLIECKWVFDNSFSDVLVNGVPEDHYLQIQGQLLASGRKWCDYVVGNRNTNRFKVIHVKADKPVQKLILESLDSSQSIEDIIDDKDLFSFTTVPDGTNQPINF